MEKGWGGPFGAVIVKDGKIIGRGQNRVLLTGLPVDHGQITAIIDACSRFNTKTLLGSDVYEGNLKLIPRPEGSPDPVPERAQMLKGCDHDVNGAPCPMCMSAFYWARIDRVDFGTRLEDTRPEETSKIAFDDEFQYIRARNVEEGVVNWVRVCRPAACTRAAGLTFLMAARPSFMAARPSPSSAN